MASDLLNKLQYKENFTCLAINVPSTFPDLSGEDMNGTGDEGSYHWIILFAFDQEEIETQRSRLFKALAEDGILWIAYPKKSGTIRSNITRDHLMELFDGENFRPVSAVSLDQDWSALRFRDQQFVTVRDRPKDDGDLPAPLKKLLKDNPDCREFFEGLSRTNRKEYVEWIRSAKKEETLERRLKDTLDRLRNEIKNPFIK